MSGLFVNSVPTTSPRPVTTFITPGGSPASSKASINTSVCIALISLGLMTTVHPAAIAGATLIAIEPALEFHGVNMPTTPAGSITTLDVPTVLTRSKSSRTFFKCRKMFAARLLEPFARSCGAPYRSEEHTSELQSRENLVCRLLLEKKKKKKKQ